MQRQLRDRAHRAHTLDVEPVAPAELELQAPEARRGLLGPTGHVVGIAEPDRPRCRRAAARHAEQLPGRASPSSFPCRSWSAASMRGFRRLLARDLARRALDLLERERVVADELPVLARRTQRALRGLLVALDRRRLTVPDDPVVREVHVDDVRQVRRVACDDERLGQAQPDDLGAHLHAPEPTATRSARCRRARRRASRPSTRFAGIAPLPVSICALTAAEVEAATGERRTDAAAGPAHTVARGARLLEGDLAAVCVAERDRGVRDRGRGRRERVRLRQHEDHRRHVDEQQHRPQGEAPREPSLVGLRHQNPKRTLVKYQRLEVSHSATSSVASVPPTTGGTQCG